MARPKLTDPADQGKDVKEAAEVEQEEEKLSFRRLSLADLKTIPQRGERVPPAFEGYPEKRLTVTERQEDRKTGKDKSVELTINATHAILLHPMFIPPQDPSGIDVPIVDPETGTERLATLRPYGVVVSHRGQSFKVDFGRRLEMDDGHGGTTIVRYAIVPDPHYRALVLYEYDSKAERIIVRRDRYLLLDDAQISRLRQVYVNIINPRIRLERRIQETFDSGVDTHQMTDLPGIPAGGE